MEPEVIIAVIAGLFAVGGSAFTYWSTKKRERETELRKEKLEHYKEFVSSLSGVIEAESTPEGQRAFSRACNKLNLVAPQSVILALQAFQQEIKVSNQDRSPERHDELMSRLFFEIRRDLAVSPKDDQATFQVGLWAAGVPPRARRK